MCFICYLPGDHISTNSPKNQQNPSDRICSNCAEASHSFQNYCADRHAPKCLKCGLGHSALSTMCAVRKTALKEKKDSE